MAGSFNLEKIRIHVIPDSKKLSHFHFQKMEKILIIQNLKLYVSCKTCIVKHVLNTYCELCKFQAKFSVKCSFFHVCGFITFLFSHSCLFVIY